MSATAHAHSLTHPLPHSFSTTLARALADENSESGSSESAGEDWRKLDLEKQKVKTLKNILEENFNGDQCTGCVEKADFIKRIRELQKKSEL